MAGKSKIDRTARAQTAAMMKRLLCPLVGAGMLLMPAAAFGQQAACDRADLEGMVNAYIAAQTTGDPGKLPLADFTQYYEQMDMASMFGGTLSKPQKIDFHRSFYDLQSCTTFTEVIVTDPAHPYVIGARLQFSGRNNPIALSRVNEIELVVTDKDDWLFNARKTLAYSKAENWSEIPPAERDNRKTIIAAADAYLDSFASKDVQVPWGTPCARLEGGLYTAKGAPGVASPEDNCNVGVPANVKLADRRYVVDETIGAVAVLLAFGDNKLPDVHSFRVEKGKIRYIHTITVCKSENCGLQLPDEIKQRLQD